MPDGSGTESGAATPATSLVVRFIEFPISNPIIGFGLKPPKNSANLKVIVTGGTGVGSLALIKCGPPPNAKSKVSGDVSKIVVGPVAVIDTESSVSLVGSKVKLPVSVSVPDGKLAVTPDSS